MNHHKFNYLSSAGAARSSSNCSHSSKLTSARFAGNTAAAHVAQSPIINFTSPLPSSSSSSLPNNTTTATTMNVMTSTYSPLSSSSGRYPIRLSPSALPYFISTIIYTIEFHAPVGPRPLPSDIASKSSSVTSRIFFSSNNNNYNNRSTRSSFQGPRNTSIAINDRRQNSLQLEDNNNNNINNSSFAESTTMINALPSSVFSAVSAIFGRTPLQALTPQLKPQNMSSPHNNINININNYGSNDSGLECTGEDELDYHEELIIDDEVLRRAREQPLVSPCTQIIHELGNVHIVVRERHNPTVEMAYNQALCDIRMILGRCREKMEKELRVKSQSQQQQQQQQRFHSSFTANRLASSQWSNNTNIIDNNSINNKKEIPTISVYGNESMNDPAMSMPAYCCSGNSHNSGKVNIGQTGHNNNKNDCTSNNNSSINRNVPNNNSSRFAASPPITYSTSSLLPLSEPPSLMRLESPSIRHDSNTIQNSSNRLSNNCNNYREKPYYDVQPDEVGMYLSVRLLTRETK